MNGDKLRVFFIQKNILHTFYSTAMIKQNQQRSHVEVGEEIIVLIGGKLYPLSL